MKNTIQHNGAPCVEARVHMLATDVVHYIGVCIKPMSDRKVGNIEYFRSPMFMSLEYWQPQHLYITTPPIGVLEDGRGYGGLKDGDAVLNIHTGEILTDIKSPKCGQWHLIIATTDPKLFIPTEYKDIEGTLPQPTQALIKAYCEQGGFDEVDVEYVYENSRCVECGEYEGSNICINRKECLKKYYGGELKLKVDSHNTITTHRIEEKMISISDLKPKLIKLLNDNDCFLDLDKWIEENL